MAKKENIKDAGKSKAGKQKPEKNAIAEIETVEDLEARYPELVSKIKDDVVGKIRECSASQIKENLPDLYQRIVEDVQGKGRVDPNVPGFLLDIEDPVAAGTLRTYQGLKGAGSLRLPFVLPYKDRETKAALENYILRANGCGDRKRAEAARKAMEKCK